MKNTFKVIALVLVLGLLQVACHDEPVAPDGNGSTDTIPAYDTLPDIDTVPNIDTIPDIDTFPPYVAVPLADYLPGTWVIDGTVVADLGYWDNYGYHDEWQFDYSYNYNGHDSLVFTDSTVYISAFGGSVGNYVILDSNRIQIQIPLYQEHYNTYDPYQLIHQLDRNRMLIKGYWTDHPFDYYLECFEYWYLFVRQ